ncbi:MAG: hypothetical protein JKY65_20585 [Planctomycetes bacterium]|nr:hypothetical protein [Planctomycetota bacterium]
MKLATADQRDLYPDRHLNVFCAYRSGAQDYNLTRALISTLRWSRPELTRAFLERFAGLKSSSESFHYDLHACDYDDFDPGRVKDQVVLGISIAGRLAENLPPLDDAMYGMTLLSILRAPAFVNAPPQYRLDQIRRAMGRPKLTDDDLAVLIHTLEELEDGCHPDGWVFSEEGSGLCLLIEAKLTQLLDLSQLQRYSDVYFGRSMEAEEMKFATWEGLAEFIHPYADDTDPRTAFLASQLSDYLDLLGLGPFRGFKPYDFDMDAAQAVLPKFLKFARQVQAAVGELGLPIANPQITPTGARLDLSGLPGEVCLDLHKTGLRVELRLGTSRGGASDLPGRLAVDHVLEFTDDGAKNPLADFDGGDLQVRVERLRVENPAGEHEQAFVERVTHRDDLVASEFGEALSELRRQHPPREKDADAAGHHRRGRLSIGRLIPHEVAAGEASALQDRVTETLATLVQVARLLGGEASGD